MHNDVRMTSPPTDEIATQDAMRILGVTRASTISRYVSTGKLTPSRQLPGKTGAFLFWRADVVRLAATLGRSALTDDEATAGAAS